MYRKFWSVVFLQSPKIYALNYSIFDYNDHSYRLVHFTQIYIARTSVLYIFDSIGQKSGCVMDPRHNKDGGTLILIFSRLLRHLDLPCTPVALFFSISISIFFYIIYIFFISPWSNRSHCDARAILCYICVYTILSSSFLFFF